MKLFASILTTAAITGTVWGLVVHQPAMADTTKMNQDKPSQLHQIQTQQTQAPQIQAPQAQINTASSNASSR